MESTSQESQSLCRGVKRNLESVDENKTLFEERKSQVFKSDPLVIMKKNEEIINLNRGISQNSDSKQYCCGAVDLSKKS